MKTEEPWWKEPTRAQWCAFGAAWAGWVLDAFDFTIFMLVMPRVAHDFGVSNLSTAGSLTLTLFARLIGGFIVTLTVALVATFTVRSVVPAVRVFGITNWPP